MMYIHEIINECNNYIKIHFTNNFHLCLIISFIVS